MRDSTPASHNAGEGSARRSTIGADLYGVDGEVSATMPYYRAAVSVAVSDSGTLA